MVSPAMLRRNCEPDFPSRKGTRASGMVVANLCIALASYKIAPYILYNTHISEILRKYHDCQLLKKAVRIVHSI